MKWGKLAQALWVATQISPYFVVVLDWGPATAFGLCLVWTDFRPQRRRARKLIAGSKDGKGQLSQSGGNSW
jgi:hypothetical protein